MNVTLLVTLCHLLSVSPDANGSAVQACQEHRVLSTYDNPSLTPVACATFAQAILAQWLGARYDDSYSIKEYRCAPGDESPRGRA